MTEQPGIIHRIVTGFWFLVDQSRRALVNILFLLFLYWIINTLFFQERPSVSSGSALVLAPIGYLVDELDYVEPLEEIVDGLDSGSDRPPQTLVRDLERAIKRAKFDNNIDALVLKLGGLYGAAPSKLQDLGDAIADFKSSGKSVYAYSEVYNQSQYYLASHADEVYMDPLGTVFIEGYSRYNTYFKDALDKLGINFHIFKVGTYKSAVEPYTRSDMSDAAKEANLAYLGDLWDSYLMDIADAREGIDKATLQAYSDNFLTNIAKLETDTATLASEANLVDGLMTRQQMSSYLMDKIGTNYADDDFKQIHHKSYLERTDDPMLTPYTGDEVAIIVAKGVIYNGSQKPGNIGGDSTAKLLRKARLDDQIKAVVMRVDSPGGSAYASEVIRREVIRLRDAGKPVVISMGSYAASGGYWISASADEIWASPTTITGSIGIFGMLPTFEEPMAKLGISRDGVGTTQLSGAFDPAKPLREDVGAAIQKSIELGYERFLTIVAEGRGMTVEEVNEIAQGRVWSGNKALEYGLVDNLGSLEDAVQSAANLAGIVSFKIRYIEQELSESEKFLKDMLGSQIIEQHLTAINERAPVMPAPAMMTLNSLKQAINELTRFNDPSHAYVHCLCSIEP